MKIRISKESGVPLHQQIAAQIEFLIGTGKLQPGDPMPSARALARQLDVHHNTVSQAYQDVTALNLLTGKRGARLMVRTPQERPNVGRPELDDLINHTILTARRNGFTLQQLSARVRERLLQETPNRVLVISLETGMQRILKAEVEMALQCPVESCSPAELMLNGELMLGALIISAPGAMPGIAAALPKDHPSIPILYATAEAHFEIIARLTKPSIVAVASVSAGFLMVASGVLAPELGSRHTLVECLADTEGRARIPAADVLICDAIMFSKLKGRSRALHVLLHNLISPECLKQMATAMNLVPTCV